MTSPEYVDYFHALPEATRYRLEPEQKGLFKGIDARADQRHLRPALPEEPRRPGAHPAAHQHRADQRALRRAPARTRLGLRQEEQEQDFALAHRGPGPGHRLPATRTPEFLEARPRPDPLGRRTAASTCARNYSIDTTGRGIFLQNAGTTPTASPRPTWAWARTATRASSASCSAARLPGREAIAFQEFGASGGRRDRPSSHAPTDRLGDFALRPSTRPPTPSCCTAG